MIINDDLFKVIDNEVEDNSLSLIITDPPYLIDYKNWDKQEIDFMHKWIEVCTRKLKSNGTMWAFMAKDNLFTHKQCPMGMVNAMQDFGTVHLENWITWSRLKGRGSSKHLKSVREEIIHFTKSEFDYTWNSLKTMREVIIPYIKDGKPRGWVIDVDGKRIRWTGLGNSWVYSPPQHNGISEKQLHPCQKPVMMLERLIRLSSNEDDLVLDPFMGSGSTAIACMLSKRKFIGIEKELKYFNIAKDRIDSFKIEQYPGYNIWTDDQIIKYNEMLTQHHKNNIYIKDTVQSSYLTRLLENN